MAFPVTGYVVFVYNDKIGSHAPQFKSMDEAESFANGVRVTTNLTVSEPVSYTHLTLPTILRV